MLTEEQRFSIQVQRNMNGITLEKTGQVEDAILLYEANITESFDGNHPYDGLTIIYRKQKRYDDVVRVLMRAVEVFSWLAQTRSRQDVPPKLHRHQSYWQPVPLPYSWST